MQLIYAWLLHSAFTWLLISISTEKKKLESAVWEYFGNKKYKNNERGVDLEGKICKKCVREVAAKAGNTSNIFADTIPPCRERYVIFIKGYKLRSYDFRDAEGIPVQS